MKGWYLLAFEHNVDRDLTPACVGDRRLVLVRQDGRLRVFDATCPHRGAHLAYGGRLCDDVIVCPFHGYSIRMGDDDGRQFSVREYTVSTIGGMVFVRLSEEHDNGWIDHLEDLERTHFIVNGFEMPVRAPMETVIENAFDQRHFHSVHGIRTDAFMVRTSEHGALIVESTFYVPTRRGSVEPAPYRAFVVSPGLVAVELRGPSPYTVITGATETPAGGCVIRLSLAFPKAGSTTPPPAAACERLLEHSRRGLEEDRVVWENLSTSIQPRWMPEDRPSQQFLEFCQKHRER